jgi:hypothetical protein
MFWTLGWILENPQNKKKGQKNPPATQGLK